MVGTAMTATIERTLWFASVIAIACAGWITSRPLPSGEIGARHAPEEMPVRRDVAKVRQAGHIVIANNPFRLDRRPAPLPFSTASQRPTLDLPQPRPMSKPFPLQLRGIAGPPWEALVDGIPGRDSPLVVRSGDRAGEYLVALVSRDTVVVRGQDSVWKLTLANRWR
jgi:hypothetical protein